MIIIRDAVVEDVPFIVEEGIKFLKLHPANLNKDIDEEYLFQLVTTLVTNHVVLIATDGGKQLGMIMGLIAPNLFNPSYIGLQEIAWWVKEESRNTTAALKLFKAFEIRAKELEVDFITMTTTSYTPTLEKLYKKNKYIPVETVYIKKEV